MSESALLDSLDVHIDDLRARSAQRGCDPRQQLVDPERLGEVVVRTAFLGSLVICSVYNGMSLLNKTADVRFTVTGAVPLIAVTIDALARRGRTTAGRA